MMRSSRWPILLLGPVLLGPATRARSQEAAAPAAAEERPYLQAALETARWLEAVAVERPVGRAWRPDPAQEAGAPWLAWCYRQAVPLYTQGQTVCMSQTGVHQGDAMA